jgi:hypothetical protein
MNPETTFRHRGLPLICDPDDDTQLVRVFTRSPLPLSPIIRVVTWSQWSHVAFLTPDFTVIESVFSHGVQEVEIDDLMRRASKMTICSYLVRSRSAILDAARSQKGKPYDTTGILGLSLHRDWQDPGDWFCSELDLWACDMGGNPYIRKDSIHRGTPQDVWKIPALRTEEVSPIYLGR